MARVKDQSKDDREEDKGLPGEAIRTLCDLGSVGLPMYQFVGWALFWKMCGHSPRSSVEYLSTMRPHTIPSLSIEGGFVRSEPVGYMSPSHAQVPLQADVASQVGQNPLSTWLSWPASDRGLLEPYKWLYLHFFPLGTQRLS